MPNDAHAVELLWLARLAAIQVSVPQASTLSTSTKSSLSSQAARGVIWTGAGQILRQVIQVGSQLVLARLLAPDVFGLLGMALVFVGIGQLLADFGIGSAIVQSRDLGGKVLSTCFWLNLSVGVVLTIVVLAAAPLVGAFYGRTDLTPLVAVLSLNLLLSALQTVPTGLLYRDMRFADIARAQVLGTLGAAAVAISMASTGFGVWALVAQPLFGTSIMLFVMWRATGWLPKLEFCYGEARPLMRFSLALLGTNLVGYGHRNVDGLLIGRFLGAGPLGVYSMAIQIMLFPLQQVSSVIVRVLFPMLAQVQDDVPRLRSAYLKAVATIVFITFPLMGGLFVLADDFVRVVFGPSWAEMAPILKVLSWVGMMQSVGTTMGSIYLAVGRTDIALRVTLVVAPVLIVGLAAGLPWGIQGVAIGYALASFSLFYYTALTAYRLIGLRLVDFHAVIVRPGLAMLVMLAVLQVAGTFVSAWPPTLRLGAGVALGGVAYLLASLLINRAQIDELLGILRSLRRRN